MLGQVSPRVLDRVRNEEDRVVLLQELHDAALGVEGKPLHVEVAQPLGRVADLVADHVRGSVEEIRVVKETPVRPLEAVVGVGDHLPHLLQIAPSVLAPVLDVLVRCPRLPDELPVHRSDLVEV